MMMVMMSVCVSMWKSSVWGEEQKVRVNYDGDDDSDDACNDDGDDECLC